MPERSVSSLDHPPKDAAAPFGQPTYTVACEGGGPALARAVDDLCRDIGRVVGTRGVAVPASDAVILIEIDPEVPGPEGYRIEPKGEGVRIAGSDPLGAIFGVYAFSHRVLGVDPYWYWKDLEPEPIAVIGMPRQPIVGRPPAFRYRGWFLNDEDLLSKWKLGGGWRDLDYPFYSHVTHPEVLDAVCETLLRSGGNMIIPGSFVDVMNPAEARLVETAVARGLYVTQHHIEPLGVSHFAYETYWRGRGVRTTLRYSAEPDRVRSTWREYARRWYELAGDRVIWQLGLRGRGDHAIWTADPAIGSEVAGRYISQAIADQWAIVQEIDERSAPPATATIYSEGADLFVEGQLQVPESVAIVFCDDGSSQQMRRDFRETPREPGKTYGAYTHIAFWTRGPHLAAGQPPERAAAAINEVAAKGDRHYAILNTSNVREHVFGIDAAMQAMWSPAPFSHEGFWARHLPDDLAQLARRYFESLALCADGQLFQDGDAVRLLRDLLASESDSMSPKHKSVTPSAIKRAAEAMELLGAEAARLNWPERYRSYGMSHIAVAAATMGCVYRVVEACIAGELGAAAAHVERMLRERRQAAEGRFADWYRGDEKADWPRLARELAERAGVDGFGVVHTKPDTALVPLLVERDFRPVAQVRARSALQIGNSPWSIGCETLDRDYADFAHTGPHLGKLGATQVRLQAGWAKCDPGDGRFHWDWLDDIVDGCVLQGVRPWLQTSYGNPAYPGGGGIGLTEGIPTSPEALRAWDRWVRALAERYSDRVDTWEIWNEPDNRNAMSPDDYARFFIRTTSIIREVQPSARIVGLAIASSDPKRGFSTRFLQVLAETGQTSLLDELSYHFYPHNPDDSFDSVEHLVGELAQYAPHVTLRQGETGAPSETRRFLAMGQFPWSERKQAAWNLRRLLAHHARGIPMSLFQLSDMYYSKKKGLFEGCNPKGQLHVRADKTVAYRKPSYFAAQHVFSLFDDRFPMRPAQPLTPEAPFRVSAYAWRTHDRTDPAVVAWWRADAPPALHTPPLAAIGLPAPAMDDPVLLDFVSGVAFALPDGSDGERVWSSLPCSDVPLAIVERAALPLWAGEADA